MTELSLLTIKVLIEINKNNLINFTGCTCTHNITGAFSVVYNVAFKETNKYCK